MAEILETTHQIVLSVRMRGDKAGPQTGDVVLEGNVLHDFVETEQYVTGEVIVKDGNIYRAKDDIDPGEWDPSLWENITDITFRINDFLPNHSYKANEVIQHQGHLYRASADFATGGEFDPNEWEAIDSVNTILQSFAPRQDYSLNEIVEKDGRLYRAKHQFVSTDSFNTQDWQLISDVIISDWEAGKDYSRGNIIINGGRLYRARKDFTSGQVWQSTDWEAVNSSGVSEFTSDTFYAKNSLVSVDGKLYLAREDFTSRTEFDINDWQVVSETIAPDYNNYTFYTTDALVFYAGSLYRARAEFTSGGEFNPADWELLSSSTTSAFTPNTEYLGGTIVFQNGILWIAKQDFTSGEYFDPKDWTPLTQNEQETYDSWIAEGNTVQVDKLDERFVNRTDAAIYTRNYVDSSTSRLEAHATNAAAELAVGDVGASLSLADEDSSTVITDEGLKMTKGDTYFNLNLDEGKLEMSEDLAKALTNQTNTMSAETKGVARADGKTTRVAEEVLSAYPIPGIYSKGHQYEQYELCSYKNEVFMARDSFIAGDWKTSQWYPVNRNIKAYTANNPYSIGDLVQEGQHLFICVNEIDSAPAARVEKDWKLLQLAAGDIVLDTQYNTVATNTNLNSAITQLDELTALAVQPQDEATKYLFAVQKTGSVAPKPVNGKTIICLYTE